MLDIAEEVDVFKALVGRNDSFRYALIAKAYLMWLIWNFHESYLSFHLSAAYGPWRGCLSHEI